MASVATRGMNKSNSTPARKKLVKAPFHAQLGAGTITKSFSLTPESEAVELVALPVFPASPFTTVPEDMRFGLQMVYDANTLIALQASKGRRLPLDIEHNTEGAGDDKRARGWIVSMTTDALEPGLGLEPGVLYAWVELNALGKQELGDKLYGFTSGVSLGYFEDEKTIRFMRVKSLALTNNPATEMPMTFAAEEGTAEDYADANYTSQAAFGAAPSEEEQMLKDLIQALGLPADTTAEAALAAVTALTVSAAAVPTLTAKTEADTVALTTAQGQVTALTAQVTDLTAKLTAKAEADAEREVVAAVDAAITAGKATPAQRETQLALARSNLADYIKDKAIALSVVAPAAAASTVTAPAETFGLTAEQVKSANTAGVRLETYAAQLEKTRAQYGL